MKYLIPLAALLLIALSSTATYLILQNDYERKIVAMGCGSLEEGTGEFIWVSPRGLNLPTSGKPR